ncbi:hypothetical protein PIB30_075554 [Stylosanthes scabra]|uniref:Uncharacterized protein n=1 Tax=Stylosanthes scabra TaxID=79078 RepID=A0ABU6USR1_9FABA|nr:hypothetical protein [Stylosanthes scabra]
MRLTTGSRLLQHRENHCAATMILTDSNAGQPRAATTVLAVTPFAIFSSHRPYRYYGGENLPSSGNPLASSDTPNAAALNPPDSNESQSQNISIL